MVDTEMTATPTQKPNAIRLAEQLRDISSRFKTPSHERGVCNAAIEELRHQHDEIARLTAENEALRKKPAPLTDAEKHAMWVMATLDQCSHEQCYLRGIKDSEAAHGIVQNIT